MKLFTLPNDPEIGNDRVVIKFAWLPKVMDNNDVIWLEMYKSIERYSYRHSMNGYGLYPEWVVLRKERLKQINIQNK